MNDVEFIISILTIIQKWKDEKIDSNTAAKDIRVTVLLDASNYHHRK